MNMSKHIKKRVGQSHLDSHQSSLRLLLRKRTFEHQYRCLVKSELQGWQVISRINGLRDGRIPQRHYYYEFLTPANSFYEGWRWSNWFDNIDLCKTLKIFMTACLPTRNMISKWRVVGHGWDWPYFINWFANLHENITVSSLLQDISHVKENEGLFGGSSSNLANHNQPLPNEKNDKSSQVPENWQIWRLW